MSTVFPFGAAICHDCRTPVAVVRRAVVVPCGGCDLGLKGCIHWDDPAHVHEVPDVAWTLVDAEGERHLCPVAA